MSWARIRFRCPVHPHTRGEIIRDFCVPHWSDGSPPHAWGDCVGCGGPFQLCRFTPTRVGRFSWTTPPSWTAAVHPHTRGEIVPTGGYTVTQLGSPPHAWGDFGAGIAPEYAGRFTPTRVGRLIRGIQLTSRRTVHPHTRGEIIWSQPSARGTHGSPPHAWGDYPPHCAPGRCRRFTPTRVGRFGSREGNQAGHPVHPHTRGEISRRSMA